MNFDDLDAQMRKYEQSLDQVLLPELYLVARLDGNRFTRLTKEVCKFEAPFDVRFRDMMIETVKALMNYGFRVIFGYTESDEISLLFHPDEDTFGRKVRKYNSLLAGVASAAFSMQLGQQAIFDCRMVPLPTLERVQDYFQWRQEDAHRNSLNSHCYWLLRSQGKSVTEATSMLSGKSVAFKNELLFQNGINCTVGDYRHNILTILVMKKGRIPREKPREIRPKLVCFLFRSVTQADFAVCYQFYCNLKNGTQKP